MPHDQQWALVSLVTRNSESPCCDLFKLHSWIWNTSFRSWAHSVWKGAVLTKWHALGRTARQSCLYGLQPSLHSRCHWACSRQPNSLLQGAAVRGLWQKSRPPYASACLLKISCSCFIILRLFWRRKCRPTPVFLPAEFHGQRNLAGYSPWGHKESFKTERLIHTQESFIITVVRKELISVK